MEKSVQQMKIFSKILLSPCKKAFYEIYLFSKNLTYIFKITILPILALDFSIINTMYTHLIQNMAKIQCQHVPRPSSPCIPYSKVGK